MFWSAVFRKRADRGHRPSFDAERAVSIVFFIIPRNARPLVEIFSSEIGRLFSLGAKRGAVVPISNAKTTHEEKRYDFAIAFLPWLEVLAFWLKRFYKHIRKF